MTLRACLTRSIEGLRGAPARGRDELRAAVEEHLAEVRRAAIDDPFVDLATAERVAAGCHALLDAWSGFDPDARAWTQVACLYFADPRDDEDDLASIVGFDDDLEVLHHVTERVCR
ncbi:MAG: hypothetical protein ABMB14_12735 [Myxococcota bacterium]